MSTTKNKELNGFDMEAIENTMIALTNNPTIGEFKFRAENTWESGTRNTSKIQGFYGACLEDTSRKIPFEVATDMPVVLNGTNKAPNPPEYLLHAVASCITTTMMLLASGIGLEVEAVTVKIEGDLNLNGFLGLDAAIKNGYRQMKISIDVTGDLSTDEKQELLTLAKRSPIYNTIINPVGIDMAIAL